MSDFALHIVSKKQYKKGEMFNAESGQVKIL